MEKIMIQVDRREPLDAPLRSTLSATDVSLASAAGRKLCSQADAPVVDCRTRESKKHCEIRFANPKGDNYNFFSLNPLKIDTLQDAPDKVQSCERCSTRSSEQQFTKRVFSEDIQLADDAWITGHGAGSSAPHKPPNPDTHHKITAAAGLLAGRSSELSVTKSFQQGARGKISEHNSVDLPSQLHDQQPFTLSVAPMAVQYPTYGDHLRYELSECKAFWSVDLHHRDWRQLFAASPFPNILPPNRLFVLRLFTSTLVLVTEVFAAVHSYKTTGWPIFLYFTSTNCVLVTVFLLLMTAVSFHSLTVWKEPLCANCPSPTDFPATSNGKTMTAAGRRTASSGSTSGRPCAISCCEAFEENRKAGANKDYVAPICIGPPQNVLKVQQKDCSGNEDAAPLRASSVTQKTREVAAAMKKMWGLQGYRDLLADRNYCVRGIIFAPNPTYHRLPCRNTAGAGGLGFYDGCNVLTKYTFEEPKQAERPLVCFLWILHSVQLVSSTTVSVVFFAMMRANGTPFAEKWYTGWRHLTLIVITVFHSLLLTRLPVPIRHVIFLYIICALYILLQVFVYVFDLPNGDGDNGCVYRVGTLKHPLRFITFALLALVFIAVVALFWWSVLRQRCADVDPPPSVSVPAAQMLRREVPADTNELTKKQPRKCFVAPLLRLWGRREVHGRNDFTGDSHS